MVPSTTRIKGKASSQSSKQQKKQRRPESASGLLRRYPYATEYGDHFETPRRAYADLSPILSLLARDLGTSPRDLKIYDPFYCEGNCKRHLASLGFENVVNERVDFYATVRYRTGRADFDVLVTNPPYSGDHKERIFRFACEIRRPWAILVPAYVAEKSYFPSTSEPFFVVPAGADYVFDHPHGAGTEISPFKSLWVVHLGERTDDVFRQLASSDPRLHRHLDDLVRAGTVRGTKRPNPRQRRRRRAIKAA